MLNTEFNTVLSERTCYTLVCADNKASADLALGFKARVICLEGQEILRKDTSMDTLSPLDISHGYQEIVVKKK